MFLLVCFEGIARLSRRVWRRFVREISLVSYRRSDKPRQTTRSRAQYNCLTHENRSNFTVALYNDPPICIQVEKSFL